MTTRGLLQDMLGSIIFLAKVTRIFQDPNTGPGNRCSGKLNKSVSIRQWIRPVQRYRRKIANDSTLGAGYNFNFRVRNSFLLQIPLGKNGPGPNNLSLVMNDEIHINFGKEIIYNYFDQNRFFLGFNTSCYQT
jgi:hypothetical protein